MDNSIPDRQHVALAYTATVAFFRSIIASAETVTNLALVEVAKARLLGFMKCYIDVCSMPMEDTERIAWIRTYTDRSREVMARRYDALDGTQYVYYKDTDSTVVQRDPYRDSLG